MPRTTIVLIRHAHTSSNGGGRVIMSGWTDLPLSQHGLGQVERLRKRLVRGQRFERIYASPLVRALDTGRPLAASGLGSLVVDDDLREIHCGTMEGLGVDDVKRLEPELWAANLRQEDDDFHWPGGESYRQLRERASRCIQSLRRRHEGERIAVVTHAGVISQIVGALRGVRAARWECYRPENASLTEIVCDRDSFWVVRFDDHTHLETGPSTHPPAG
jgi:broad specificity phosphatase PhoE